MEKDGSFARRFSPDDEKRIFVEDFSSHPSTLKALTDAGIPEEDRYELGEIRDSLRESFPFKKIGRLQTIDEDVASVDCVIEAYMVCGGDIETVRKLAEYALDSEREARHGSLTKVMREVTDQYRKHGEAFFSGREDTLGLEQEGHDGEMEDLS